MPNPEPPNSSSFASDVLKLAGGTALAQVLAILASPVITRLYSPEALGVATLFTSIVGIVGVVACLRYELAIMLPKRDEEAVNLLGLSLLLAAAISALLVPMIWLWQRPLLQLLNAPELAPYMWLIPPAVSLTGVFMALNYWNSRTKRFGRLSIARLNASVATVGVQIGAGLGGYATGGSLIIAGLFGSFVSTMVLAVQILRDDKKIFNLNINKNQIISLFREYKKFPIIDFWTALLNTISWRLPTFILFIFFSPEIVGFYSLSFMTMQLPMSLIGSAISQVFFQRASAAKIDGSLPQLVEKIFVLFVSIGTIPSFLMLLIAPDIFSLMFGPIWTESGVYVQIMSVWFLAWFISSGLGFVHTILQKQEIGFKINTLIFISRLFSLLIGGYLGNARFAIVLFSLSGIIIYGYLCIKMIQLSGANIYILKSLLYAALYAVPLVLIIEALKYINIYELNNLYIIIVVSILYYISYLRLKNILYLVS
jgi:O-antigen/teichoic acid export membrane protein